MAPWPIQVAAAGAAFFFFAQAVPAGLSIRDTRPSSAPEPMAVPNETNAQPLLGVRGVLHFLFLAYGSVAHTDLWKQFLAAAPPGSYSLWLHCKDYEKCVEQLESDPFPEMHLIPRTQSLYQWDQFSPHIRLMEEALRCSQAGLREKFVLVSSVTLPTAPFATVYMDLLADDRSYVCPLPTDQWTNFSFGNHSELIPKVHEWVVLNRFHAKRLVKDYVPGHLAFLPWPHDNYSYVLVEKPDAFWHGRSIENMYYIYVFGLYRPYKWRQQMGPGTCKTWAVWKLEDPVGELLRDDTSSVIKKADGYHPTRLIILSKRALQALRSSSTLFARKFTEESSFPFASEILFDAPRSSHVKELPAPACMGGTAPVAPFMVHFLFLLERPMPVSLVKVWAQFFKGAAVGQHSAKGLCFPGKGRCGRDEDPVPWHWVHPEEIYSTRCRDWVTAFVHLLKSALRGEGFLPEEKFILLGDSFLPLKPFSHIFKVLSPAAELLSLSDLCLRRQDSWIRLRSTEELSKDLYLVVHSRWVVLSRHDARMLLKVWERPQEGQSPAILYCSRSLHPQGEPEIKRIALEFDSVCAEEVAVYTLLFGLFPKHPDNNVNPLWVTEDLMNQDIVNPQSLLRASRCRTLDLNDHRTTRYPVRLLKTMEAHEELIVGAKSLGITVQHITKAAAAKLRATRYLFLTPVTQSAALEEVSQELLADDRG